MISRRILTITVISLAPVLLHTAAPPASAHPLGNDSVTHFSVLYILPDRLELDLVLDIAESPSAILRRAEIDADKDDVDTAAEQRAWLNRKAVEYQEDLKATIDGQTLRLLAADEAFDPRTGRKAAQSRVIFKQPGVAGMPTYRMLIRYVAVFPEQLTAGEHVLAYEDAIFPGYLGLKRIILERIPEIEVFDPHPDFWDPDRNPMIYEQYDPANLPQEHRATIRFRVVEKPATVPPAPEVASAASPAGSQPVAPAPLATRPAADEEPYVPPYLASLTDPRNDPSRTSTYSRQASRIVNLLQGRWGFMTLLTVTVLSFTWGAAHALMPGHAKTVVAAYLISQQGTYWHAVFLAVIVTLTHTALVVILGLIIWVYQETHPALGAWLQQWLGVIAGLLVAGMGAMLCWRAVTGRMAYAHHEGDHRHPSPADHRPWWRTLFTHSHPDLPLNLPAPGHGHPHPHVHEHNHHHDHMGNAHTHPDDRDHPHDHTYTPDVGRALTVRLLLALGITGGIVPCPTATFIMLLGIGANVMAGALYAVGVFSLGLALALMAVGILALSSRRFASRILADAHRQGRLTAQGNRLLVQIIPALSGLLVMALGAAITTNYLYFMRHGRALIRWLG